MKLLLLERHIKIHPDFQKLLDNSLQLYGESKNEIISMITNDKIVFQEINFNEKKEEYYVDYNCYVFLDVKKSIYRNLELINESYFELSNAKSAYRSWTTPAPFLSNLRTDYDKYNNLSLLYLSLSYSNTFSMCEFLRNESKILHFMETSIMSYADSLILEFEYILSKKYFN